MKLSGSTKVHDLLATYPFLEDFLAAQSPRFEMLRNRIRYLALRDAGGAYRGCLEVTQDVTHIRQLQGERRLLSWESGG